MAKKDKFDKIKEGVSVEEIENFARKYTSEVFSVLAILIATISSAFDFFTGPSLSIWVTGLGTIVGLLLPEKTEDLLAKLYSFIQKQEKTTQIIIGVVRIVIALFIPFILFAVIGCLAGSSTHEHMKRSGMGSKRGSSRSSDRDEEHL